MIKLSSEIKNEYYYKFVGVTPNSKMIEYNDNIVGFINYKEKNEYIYIYFIEIKSEYKRKNIASKVIDIIKEENKGKYVKGESLPSAIKFWEKIGATFILDNDDYLTPFIINN